MSFIRSLLSEPKMALVESRVLIPNGRLLTSSFVFFGVQGQPMSAPEAEKQTTPNSSYRGHIQASWSLLSRMSLIKRIGCATSTGLELPWICVFDGCNIKPTVRGGKRIRPVKHTDNFLSKRIKTGRKREGGWRVSE